MKIEKILTDNPYVDEVVYYTKILALGTVLKNETLALNGETLQSMQASSLYMACLDGVVLFEQLTFTKQMLESVGVPPANIDRYLIDQDLIPTRYRPKLIEIASASIIANYIEYNNYYRMLNGMPPVGDKGIKVTNWDAPDDVIIDLTKYVHEMTTAEIGVLDNYGIIDQLIEDNRDKEYLKYLGEKRIDIYKARRATRFEALYLPSVESTEMYDRFKTRLDINRVFTLRTVYSEAFKYGSDYYDNFIAIFIVIQTMIDILSSIQEMIARKEVFDLRTIQYIFQSYNMPFYPEIPTKYQIAMMKNINKLIKYKSTTKSMVDICSLFGFDNIEIFKYYLLRNRRRNDDGSFMFETTEIHDPNFPDDPDKMITVEDTDRNFDLKFIRIPLEDNADDYIKNPNNYLNYDDVTLSDPTWDGELEHSYIKSQIIKEEFNYVRTKYISIDTIYEVTKLSFEMPYFFNMLFDDIKLEENLVLFVPYINSVNSFKLTDIFCFLFALTYEYNGMEDSIMDTTGKVLHVKGFNFKADLAELGRYVQQQGYTLQDLGVDGFMIPKTSIMSYNQLLEIFVKNGKIRDHLIDQMIHADNKKIYDIYKNLYESLMISKFNTDYFRNPTTKEMPATYTEFLQFRDSILYLTLMDIKEIQDADVKVQRISTVINNIVYALDEYIDSDEYKYLYSNLPSVSSEHIKQYVVKVIDFFKSYKIDMLGLNTVYKFDDKLDNTIKIIDDIYRIYYVFNKDEFITTADRLSKQSNFTFSEKMAPLEKIYMDIKTWINLNCREDISLVEVIAKYTITKDLEEEIKQTDNMELKTLLSQFINYILKDEIAISANIEYKEVIPYNDIKQYVISLIQTIKVQLKEAKSFNTILEPELNIPYRDILNLLVSTIASDRVNLIESVTGYGMNMSLKDKCNILDSIINTISMYIKSELSYNDTVYLLINILYRDDIPMNDLMSFASNLTTSTLYGTNIINESINNMNVSRTHIDTSLIGDDLSDITTSITTNTIFKPDEILYVSNY